jgi:hypothetical protein
MKNISDMKITRYVLLVLFIVFGGVGSLWAKQVAQYASNERVEASQESNKTVFLKDRLDDFETGYNVVFLYKSEIINGKITTAKKLDGDIYNKLKKVLEPHGLKYTYLGNRTFVISQVEEKSQNFAVQDTHSWCGNRCRW